VTDQTRTVEIDAEIERPTIGQFIEFLKQFPVEAPLRIVDADTEWIIDIIHAQNYRKRFGEIIDIGTIYLSGDYGEMDDER
jgi:hypothetical protein